MARKQPTPVQVQAAIAKLREYHQQGRRLLEEHEPGARRWADMKAVCQRHRLPPHQVRTLRKFAARYTEADLDRLCNQCQKSGRVVGLAAITHLLKIGDKQKRFQVQSKMIDGGWSSPRIVAELKQVLRRPWKGGRKPRIAEDVPGVLVQLQDFAIAWRRWFERLADEDDEDVLVRPAELGSKIQAGMSKVTEAFTALNEEVSGQQVNRGAIAAVADRKRGTHPRKRHN